MENKLTNQSLQSFRPVLLSRRGEVTAWGVSLLWTIGTVVIALTQPNLPGAVIFMAVLLLLAALAISLGNWMDRHTEIAIYPHSISFQNGLRKVNIPWEEVQKIEVYPSNWGKKIRVIGKEATFDFRTLGEIRVQGEIKGQMGFEQGEQILKTIVEKAGLQPEENQQTKQYYYVRK